MFPKFKRAYEQTIEQVMAGENIDQHVNPVQIEHSEEPSKPKTGKEQAMKNLQKMREML